MKIIAMKYLLALFLVVIAIACQEADPEVLRKLTVEEIVERTQNRQMPDPNKVIYKMQDGEVIPMEELMKVVNPEDYAFDCYADASGEVVEIVYRKVENEADRAFLQKVKQAMMDGPEITLIPIDCDQKQQILQSVFDTDQAMRKGGGQIDPDIDRQNLTTVVSLLEQCGMPSEEEVGEIPLWGVVVALQHSSPRYLKKYYPLLKKEFGIMPIVEDRLLMWEGKPQIYGTQIQQGKLYNLQDPETVNERRAAVGLGPIEEYLERFGVE